MKEVKSNLAVLLAERQRATRKRISLRSIARDTGIPEYTVRGFANDTLNEYPKRAITALCNYLQCTPGDLLVMVDADTPAQQ